MPNNYWLLQYIYAKYSNVNVFVTSDKQAGSIPEELFDGAAGQSIATVNFSKNQLTSVPPRYTHTPSLSFFHTQSITVWQTVKPQQKAVLMQMIAG